MKLTVELNGIEPDGGCWVGISKHDVYPEGDHHEELIQLINKVLDEGAQYTGGGLDGLRPLHVELSISIITSKNECRPSFYLDARIISRLSSAGASLDFDPYIQSK
ncbi:DUF4279 domain-containing protein [Salmonella enterica subsp. enterica]|nr:DUF4279 domain-containing protein [Salmonella enterica subsp. enterica]